MILVPFMQALQQIAILQIKKLTNHKEKENPANPWPQP